MDAWIKAKYVDKKFTASTPPSTLQPVPIPLQYSRKAGFGQTAGPTGPSAEER